VSYYYSSGHEIDVNGHQLLFKEFLWKIEDLIASKDEYDDHINNDNLNSTSLRGYSLQAPMASVANKLRSATAETNLGGFVAMDKNLSEE
jgi:hypothetical protein